MKKQFILILIFFNYFHTNAQSNKEIALYQIQDLKQSALLVRLSTSENQLEILRKMKNMNRYNEVKKAQEEENQKIIHAFTSELSFVPAIYFFASNKSEQIKNGNLSNVLLDKNLKVVDSIPFKTFYIAEFGRTEELNIPAVVIMNSNFKQLDEPFPFFTRTYETLPIIKRSHQRTVELLNEKLYSFYNQVVYFME